MISVFRRIWLFLWFQIKNAREYCNYIFVRKSSDVNEYETSKETYENAY